MVAQNAAKINQIGKNAFNFVLALTVFMLCLSSQSYAETQSVVSADQPASPNNSAAATTNPNVVIVSQLRDIQIATKLVVARLKSWLPQVPAGHTQQQAKRPPATKTELVKGATQLVHFAQLKRTKALWHRATDFALAHPLSVQVAKPAHPSAAPKLVISRRVKGFKHLVHFAELKRSQDILHRATDYAVAHPLPAQDHEKMPLHQKLALLSRAQKVQKVGRYLTAQAHDYLQQQVQKGYQRAEQAHLQEDAKQRVAEANLLAEVKARRLQNQAQALQEAQHKTELAHVKAKKLQPAKVHKTHKRKSRSPSRHRKYRPTKETLRQLFAPNIQSIDQTIEIPDPDTLDSFNDLTEMEPILIAMNAPVTDTAIVEVLQKPAKATSRQSKVRRVTLTHHAAIAEPSAFPKVHAHIQRQLTRYTGKPNPYLLKKDSPKIAHPPQKVAVRRLRAKPARYTLQIAVVRDRATITRLVEQYRIKNSRVIRVQREQQPVYALVIGNFSSRQAAVNRLKSLPEQLQTLRPWVRNLTAMQ
jgi:septal ring-binding cell division protein DamX